MEKNGYLESKGVDTGFGAIGRNGELIKMQRGRHRLSIAKLVGAPTIPIRILFVHPEWISKVNQKKDNFNFNNLLKALNATNEKYM